MIVCELACFYEFIVALILSLVIGSIYDIVRCIPAQKRILTDCIYVIVCLGVMTFTWIFLLFGSLRWYVVLTVIFGVILYFLTISRYVFVFVSFITKKICKIFSFFLKFLLTPIKFLCKISLCMDKRGRMPKCKRGRAHDKDKIKI
ncbi:MAG: hypothetical protein E7417_02625 [Ruminococcaceae bacterium]|nr:hypothetical protein [Oscillospiraceae bacterium]